MKIKQTIIKIGLTIIIGTSNYVYAEEAGMTVSVTNSTTCQITCKDDSCSEITARQLVTGFPVYSFYVDNDSIIMDKVLKQSVPDDIKYSTYSSQSSFSVILSKAATGDIISEFANSDPLFYNNGNVIQYIVYSTDTPRLLLWSGENPCTTTVEQ